MPWNLASGSQPWPAEKSPSVREFSSHVWWHQKWHHIFYIIYMISIKPWFSHYYPVIFPLLNHIKNSKPLFARGVALAQRLQAEGWGLSTATGPGADMGRLGRLHLAGGSMGFLRHSRFWEGHLWGINLYCRTILRRQHWSLVNLEIGIGF